jgi:2-polyprenyl-6-methoxyphenol hydroxylase-like FAD-dependent oxidoreductase
MKIAIVGGSVGGLTAGILLKEVGHDVTIYERTEGHMADRGAGIVMQAETITILDKLKESGSSEVSVYCDTRRYLQRDGSTEAEMPMAQSFTSWNILYRRLRGHFPDSDYKQGHKLASLSPDATTVKLAFGGGKEAEAELVVGADGVDSVVRAHFYPQLKPSYAGYVAWRGVLLESELSPAILAELKNRFTFYQFSHSHILCYFIPGVNGETTPGKRRLNWLWYVNYAKGKELDDVMTDNKGVHHTFSVPPGLVREEWIQKLHANARGLLPYQYQYIVQQTQKPFVQPILDLSVHKMAFDRVALIGDAAFVPRPHTAASTSKAIGNAFALAQALDESPDHPAQALADWEPQQLQIGQYLAKHGQTLGNRSQFGDS